MPTTPTILIKKDVVLNVRNKKKYHSIIISHNINDW